MAHQGENLGSESTVRAVAYRKSAFFAVIARASSLIGALFPFAAGAQTVTATVTTAPLPIAAAVNSVTNKVYVSSYIEKGQVTVIDGATNSTTAIPVGSDPYGIDVNMVTNKVYVANSGSNSVTVIDGATNATTTIPVGINPTAVAVNPVTNTIYVVNSNLDGTISVIDGATNTVTNNIFAGWEPSPVIAVDTANNTLFACAGSNNTYTVGSQTVYLIDGSTGVIHEAEVGNDPLNLAVNPATDQLYVANFGTADVVSIATASMNEGGDDHLTNGGTSVAVNTVTNLAYFAGYGSVCIVDGATDALSTVTVGPSNIQLGGIAVDPIANAIYTTLVTNQGSLVSIDGITNKVTTLPVGSYPSIVAVNPVTHKVYVVNDDAVGTVSIVEGLPVAAAPAIVGEPQSQTVNLGSTVVFNAAATGRPSPTYQWSFNGVPLSDASGVSGSAGSVLVFNGVTAANAGSYTCTATNRSGSSTSATANLAVINTANAGRITNLSTRATIAGGTVSDGSNVLIAGFVISGSGSKPLIIRGIGPALAGFGLSNAVDKPSLALFDAASPPNLITSDTLWQTPPSLPASAPWLGTVAPVDATPADFAQVGAFALPNGSSDAAVKISLPAGSYTSQVTADDGSSGIVLAELYDEDPGNTGSQLINISSRALVSSGSGVMIAGFEISGSSAQTVLIRASGPALAALGVSGTAPNPNLLLYDSSGNLVASNVNWGGDPEIAAVASSVGAFTWTDPNSTDSALLLTLSPGTYTAEVSPGYGYSGIALIEVYAVP